MEEHGNVMKIYTNQGPYALKKIEGRKLERNNFLHHIQYLKEKGFQIMYLYIMRRMEVIF